MKHFLLENLGCRASQADGAALAAALRSDGMTPLEEGAADLIVVNTCTVTQSADADARATVRRLHRQHPGADILVTGCYAQRAPTDLTALPGVRWVLGNSHKTQAASVASESESDTEYHGAIRIGDISAPHAFEGTPLEDTRSDRTRPNLKIQDGCSNRCSFCIIPSVRGRSRSAPAQNVVEQVRDLAERYREVVLSGINLGRWGRDFTPSSRFVNLLRLLLTETPIARLRLSSVEPMDWSDDLLHLMANEAPRIAEHVHMPLQSGSDAVLKRMFRKYRTRHYAGRLALAHRLMPDAAIGADVMTGFPGESENEFAETVRFIEDQPFTYLHVFTYSERSGTAAASYDHSVPVPLRRERTAILRQLSERKQRAFRERMLGRLLPAVTLQQGGWALTSNFLRIEMTQAREPNQLVQLRIGAVTNDALRETSPFPILPS
ncbi:MAG: tRNA (N(6)-L-threonylcarbamoyladenosine(37)-C(2))-methylthiotransferase MtaB [Rhodospirillales bacterium]|nr:tRNA (N(6)-L-threonylcarbamoyladenosine(37)-C(2))-methylthiotransferase MtaB [Acetobacter sp.]